MNRLLRGHHCRFPLLLGYAIIAACHGGSDSVPGDPHDSRPWSRIAPGESVQARGTEPFWSVKVDSSQLTYARPDDPRGTTITVRRFAGRGGLSFTGDLDGESVTLAISAGPCRDGMSDRHYPFSASLAIGARVQNGCAWTSPETPEPSGRAGAAPPRGTASVGQFDGGDG